MTFSQIVDKINRECKTNNSRYTLAQKVVDINLALDEAISIALDAGGTWQYDDQNHTDYPIIYTSLVSGQRDYAFTDDEQGNLILDIYRVFVKHPGGVYQEIYPIDAQSDESTEAFTDGQNLTGVPTRYDKTGNGILLDYIPHSSIYTNASDLTDGLKVYINREGSYFTTSDTTKKPGIDPLCHDFMWLKPAYEYARTHSLKNRVALRDELEMVRKRISERYARRERDVVNRLTARQTNDHI